MRGYKSKKKNTFIQSVIPFPILHGFWGAIFFMSFSAILLLISIVRPATFEGLRVATADSFRPVLKTVSVPIQTLSFMIRDTAGITQLQAENTRLQEENARLRDWYQTALFLESENKSLRSLLNVQDDLKKTFVTARLLADSNNRFVKTVLINVGTKKNVQKNQAVMSGEGMIGRIIEVGDDTSRILLLTDVNARIPVLISENNTHAILAGDNSTTPRLTHVNSESKISDGAHVITSGKGGVFPFGIPVGQIMKTQEGEYKVNLFADIENLVYVRVLNVPVPESGL